MHRTRALALTLGLSALGYLIDQSTKLWFFSPRFSSIIPEQIQPWFTFTQYKNFGIAFSLPVPQLVTIIITVAILILILREIWLKKFSWPELIPLALILAGAFGNLYDRLALNYVRDWLLFFNRSAINLADVMIVVGGGWYLLSRYNSYTEQSANR